MNRCQGKSRRTGEPCNNPPVKGRKYCRLHGGKQRVGPAHPAWIDGRDSDYLPKRMLDDYKTSAGNANILALTSDIALADSRIVDMLKRVDRGESGRIYEALHATWRDYEAAKAARDTTAMAAALNAHAETLKQGRSDYAAWDGIFALVERRRRLVDTERKRLVEAQQMMQRDQVLALMGLLVESVTEHVHDDDIRSAIVNDFVRLSSGVSDG